MITSLLPGKTRTIVADPDVAAAIRDKRAAESILSETSDPQLIDSAVLMLAAAEAREKAALRKVKSQAA